MNLRSAIRLFSKVSLFFTFVVVIAGSVVRMTGSGMGCPDWPKCFGYFIPPISEDALSAGSNRSFEKGQMVIVNDTLWVANHSLTIQGSFDRTQWHKYPKHDYAVFNVLHTWVEYVNRLATVLYAIPIIILSFLCLLLLIREKDWVTFLLALFTDIMIAYEIWLGKLVVDGNLKENSITYHMFGSVAIVSLLLLLVFRHRINREKLVVNQFMFVSMILMLVLSFLQVILGTQVREEVDVVAKMNADRSVWIEMLPTIFKIHRSFSILIGGLAILLFIWNRKLERQIAQVNAVVLLVGLEIIAGVILSYFAMPRSLQPLHLLMGVMLFAFSFYGVLRVAKK